VIARDVAGYLPFIATENLLMASVKKGGNRQEMHEAIRRNSLEAAHRMNEGEDCDLLAMLGADPAFNLSLEEIQATIHPEDFIGRSVEQTERFLAQIPDYEDVSGEVDLAV
jgi:adenylosuccinate lyase